jgi:hypothetical protein
VLNNYCNFNYYVFYSKFIGMFKTHKDYVEKSDRTIKCDEYINGINGKLFGIDKIMEEFN